MPASVSFWAHTALPETRPALTRDINADVCVVGAGIAGLTTAYLLGGNGRSVVVIDAATPGGGQSGGTTAHLSTVLDDRYLDLVRLHGVEGARLAADSHR